MELFYFWSFCLRIPFIGLNIIWLTGNDQIGYAIYIDFLVFIYLVFIRPHLRFSVLTYCGSIVNCPDLKIWSQLTSLTFNKLVTFSSTFVSGSKLPSVVTLQTKDPMDSSLPERAPAGTGPPREDAHLQPTQTHQGQLKLVLLSTFNWKAGNAQQQIS